MRFCTLCGLLSAFIRILWCCGRTCLITPLNDRPWPTVTCRPEKMRLRTHLFTHTTAHSYRHIHEPITHAHITYAPNVHGPYLYLECTFISQSKVKFRNQIPQTIKGHVMFRRLMTGVRLYKDHISFIIVPEYVPATCVCVCVCARCECKLH